MSPNILQTSKSESQPKICLTPLPTPIKNVENIWGYIYNNFLSRKSSIQLCWYPDINPIYNDIRIELFLKNCPKTSILGKFWNGFRTIFKAKILEIAIFEYNGLPSYKSDNWILTLKMATKNKPIRRFRVT